MTECNKTVAQKQQEIAATFDSFRNVFTKQDEMRRFVEAVPVAKHNPFYNSAIVSMMQTIKNLKWLVWFLSKLNKIEYFQWMNHAFSGFRFTKRVMTSPMAKNETYSHTAMTSKEKRRNQPPSQKRLGKKRRLWY